VVGHTSCGGCTAAIANKKIGAIDVWLQPLRELRAANWATLQGMSTADQINALARLNVVQGRKNVLEHPSVMAADQVQGVQVHGIMYDLASGILSDLGISESGDVLNKRVGSFLLT